MIGRGWLRSKRRIEWLKDQSARVFLIGGGVVMLLPLAWMVVTALKDDFTVRNRPTEWTISLPAKVRSGALRFDMLFFVQEEFAEEDLADFEEEASAGIEIAAIGGGSRVERTAAAWRAATAEAERLKLARQGESALELHYDFREHPAATARIAFVRPRTFRALSALHLWILGDGSGHELTLRLETDRGTLITSHPWRVDFPDWTERSCYFREMDRLAGMPLLVPEGAPEGAATWFEPSQPLDLEVRAVSLTLTEVPYARALARKLSDNFRRVADAIPLGRYYWNTLLVAFIVTAAQVATSSLAAYAFARLRFPGRDTLFFLYLATLMIPADVLLIPRFILVQKAGLYDRFPWAVVLPALATAYGTFLLRQFFLTIPKELEEAAVLDGCGQFGIYWRIIMPLATPALATLAVMSFIGAWNMLLWPLIVTSSQKNWVLQVGMSNMQNALFKQYNVIMAGAIIALVPAMIVFTSAQRAFREGIVLSGIKQ